MRFRYVGVVSGTGTIVDREYVHGRKVEEDEVPILIEELDREDVDHPTYNYPMETMSYATVSKCICY